MFPLTQNIKLGDFCQTVRGLLVPQGNIEQLRILDETLLSPSMLLEPEVWRFSHGVELVMQQQHNEYTEQLLRFYEPGSCVFYLNEPKAQYILNWQEIKDNLTIKLTQTDYSFRDVFVITAVTTGADWSGVIAGKAQAELKLVADCYANGNDHHHLLRNDSVKAEIIQNIDYFEKHTEQPCYFFQAKKLVLSEQEKQKVRINHIKNGNQGYLPNYRNNHSIEQIPGKNITINNCLDYFEWADVSLDDVELLCQNL
jgi:hypothetical protein